MHLTDNTEILKYQYKLFSPRLCYAGDIVWINAEDECRSHIAVQFFNISTHLGCVTDIFHHPVKLDLTGG